MFVVSLAIATLLVTLVAGIVLCFAIIVMPGSGSLDDRAFLRSFQVMDRIIQDNHPVFMLVWVGSIVAVIVTLVLGYGQLEGTDRIMLWAASLLYLLGVQLPTIRFNIPLNNQLQTLDLGQIDEATLQEARAAFEPSWNRWNRFRTAVSCVSAAMFVLLLIEV